MQLRKRAQATHPGMPRDPTHTKPAGQAVAFIA